MIPWIRGSKERSSLKSRPQDEQASFSTATLIQGSRMITDIQKCKNDSLFSDQVLVLLTFSNGRECEAVMKTVVLVISILRYRCSN